MIEKKQKDASKQSILLLLAVPILGIFVTFVAFFALTYIFKMDFLPMQGSEKDVSEYKILGADTQKLSSEVIDENLSVLNKAVITPDNKFLLSIIENKLKFINLQNEKVTEFINNKTAQEKTSSQISINNKNKNIFVDSLASIFENSSVKDLQNFSTLAFYPNLETSTFAVATSDNNVEIFNTIKNQDNYILNRATIKHDSKVISIAFSNNGQFISIVDVLGRVEIYKFQLDGNALSKDNFKTDTEEFKDSITEFDTENGISSAVFSPDDKFIATTDKKGNVNIWSFDGQNVSNINEFAHSKKVSPSNQNFVSFNHDGNFLVSSDQEGTIDLRTFSVVRKKKVSSNLISSVTIAGTANIRISPITFTKNINNPLEFIFIGQNKDNLELEIYKNNIKFEKIKTAESTPQTGLENYISQLYILTVLLIIIICGLLLAKLSEVIINILRSKQNLTPQKPVNSKVTKMLSSSNIDDNSSKYQSEFESLKNLINSKFDGLSNLSVLEKISDNQKLLLEQDENIKSTLNNYVISGMRNINEKIDSRFTEVANINTNLTNNQKNLLDKLENTKTFLNNFIVTEFKNMSSKLDNNDLTGLKNISTKLENLENLPKLIDAVKTILTNYTYSGIKNINEKVDNLLNSSLSKEQKKALELFITRDISNLQSKFDEFSEIIATIPTKESIKDILLENFDFNKKLEEQSEILSTVPTLEDLKTLVFNTDDKIDGQCEILLAMPTLEDLKTLIFVVEDKVDGLDSKINNKAEKTSDFGEIKESLSEFVNNEAKNINEKLDIQNTSLANLPTREEIENLVENQIKELKESISNKSSDSKITENFLEYQDSISKLLEDVQALLITYTYEEIKVINDKLDNLLKVESDEDVKSFVSNILDTEFKVINDKLDNNLSNNKLDEVNMEGIKEIVQVEINSLYEKIDNELIEIAEMNSSNEIKTLLSKTIQTEIGSLKNKLEEKLDELGDLPTSDDIKNLLTKFVEVEINNIMSINNLASKIDNYFNTVSNSPLSNEIKAILMRFFEMESKNISDKLDKKLSKLSVFNPTETKIDLQPIKDELKNLETKFDKLSKLPSLADIKNILDENLGVEVDTLKIKFNELVDYYFSPIYEKIEKIEKAEKHKVNEKDFINDLAKIYILFFKGSEASESELNNFINKYSQFELNESFSKLITNLSYPNNVTEELIKEKLINIGFTIEIPKINEHSRLYDGVIKISNTNGQIEEVKEPKIIYKDYEISPAKVIINTEKMPSDTLEKNPSAFKEENFIRDISKVYVSFVKKDKDAKDELINIIEKYKESSDEFKNIIEKLSSVLDEVDNSEIEKFIKTELEKINDLLLIIPSINSSDYMRCLHNRYEASTYEKGRIIKIIEPRIVYKGKIIYQGEVILSAGLELFEQDKN